VNDGLFLGFLQFVCFSGVFKKPFNEFGPFIDRTQGSLQPKRGFKPADLKV